MTRSQKSPRRRTLGLGGVAVVNLLAGVFALGGLGDHSTPRDDRVLIASFGAGMAVFGVALAVLAVRDRRAWWPLLFLPLFLAVHVVALGTVLPDAIFLGLVVAGLAGSAPWVDAPTADDHVAQPSPART